ncbi:hypothetical protein [Asticcacaulis tiandongensis]|uniref:hypothetical protein n=1 Tax=Asticcacaulis tiandongensis TaxID=2565365 RepID=UPI00112AFEA8|nr:hypothetical protein [Asticcacaulis tiandongensis]
MTPANFSDTATVVEPTQTGKGAFAIGECVPGTIDPWEVPAASDGQSFDSQTMLTCRSRRSALGGIGIYLLVVLAGLALLRYRSLNGKAAI